MSHVRMSTDKMLWWAVNSNLSSCLNLQLLTDYMAATWLANHYKYLLVNIQMTHYYWLTIDYFGHKTQQVGAFANCICSLYSTYYRCFFLFFLQSNTCTRIWVFGIWLQVQSKHFQDQFFFLYKILVSITTKIWIWQEDSGIVNHTSYSNGHYAMACQFTTYNVNKFVIQNFDSWILTADEIICVHISFESACSSEGI